MTEKEELIKNGWQIEEDPFHPGSEFWEHPEFGNTYTRSGALRILRLQKDEKNLHTRKPIKFSKLKIKI